MGIRNVPTSIRDPNLAGFLRELRAAIGGVSDQVTKLVQTKSSSGGPNPNPNPNPEPPPGGGGGDGYPPPAPTSLQAIPGAFNVTLVWTNPVIPDLQATEVWARRSFSAWVSTYEYLANAKVLVNGTVYRSRKAQDVNSTTNVVTLNKGFNPPTSPDWWEATTLAPTDKSYIGESAGNSWIHDGLTPGETWAYWVRNRDVENLFSGYFPDDDIGVITTTLLDPGAYLDLLTNSITATQLYRDLGQRINLIDGPLSLPNSVAYRVAEEAKARADGLAAEALARETGIYNESVVRKTGDEQLAQNISIVNAKADNAAAAVISEQTARVNADGALGQRIDAVVATANGNTAAITSEATARANADGALSTRIDTVVATTDNNTAAIQTETSARTTEDSALSQRIDVVVAKADSNAAAITAEQTARADADGSLAQNISQVQAVANSKTSVYFQASAPSTSSRVVGDLWYDTDDNNKQYRWSGSDWVVYRDSTKTYRQTTAPTNTADNPLYEGDLWIDTTTELVDGVQTPKNIQYRWSGSAWVDVSKGLTKAEQSALITNLEQTKIGYCTIGNPAIATDHTTKATCEAAGGTWHVGLPLATAVKQVSVTVSGVCYKDGVSTGDTTEAACLANNGAWVPGGGSAAMEQQFLVQQQTNGKLYSQYTVKLDTNGWVSGFGLAGTQQSDGTVISDFGVRADRFWIAAPNTPNINGFTLSTIISSTGQVLGTTGVRGDVNNPFRAYFYLAGTTVDAAGIKTGDWITLKDIYYADRTTPNGYYNQSWQVSYAGGNQVEFHLPTSLPGHPYDPGYGFATSSTDPAKNDPPRVVPGNRLPIVVTTTPRTYNGVTIPAGVFMNTAYIVDASITNAKIYGDIRSTDYNGAEAPGGSGSGTAGWCINKNGVATFNNGIWRNWLASKTFFSSGGTFDSANNISNFGTDGWALDQSGTAVFNRVIVRSGKNVEANALSWTRFYDGISRTGKPLYTFSNGSTTGNSFSGGATTANGVPTVNSGYPNLCWTNDYLTLPTAAGRTTYVVCSLTFESPTKTLGYIGDGQWDEKNPRREPLIGHETANVTVAALNIKTPVVFPDDPYVDLGTALNMGSCDGVWLALTATSGGSATEVDLVELFYSNSRDIFSRFFSGQAAFALSSSTISAYTGFHIRIKVRRTGGTNDTYSGLKLMVHAYVE